MRLTTTTMTAPMVRTGSTTILITTTVGVITTGTVTIIGTMTAITTTTDRKKIGVQIRVLLIIGLLAAIALPNYMKFVNKIREMAGCNARLLPS